MNNASSVEISALIRGDFPKIFNLSTKENPETNPNQYPQKTIRKCLLMFKILDLVDKLQFENKTVYTDLILSKISKLDSLHSLGLQID